MKKTKRFTLVSFVLALFIAVVGFGIISNANKTVKAEDTYVAQIGETSYATLQEAFDYASESGGTITLLTDLTDTSETYTFTQSVGNFSVFDGNGKTFGGTIEVAISSATKDKEDTRFTIKNVNFVDETNSLKDFIRSNAKSKYPHITVEDCTFLGAGSESSSVAIRLWGAYNTVIKGCTVTNCHSLIQLDAGRGIAVENVNVVNCGGGLSLGTTQNDITVKNVNIEAVSSDGYGIRLEGQHYVTNVVIEDCEIKAFIPIFSRKITSSNIPNNSNYVITIQGANVFNASNTSGYCYVASSEKDFGTDEVIGTPAANTNVVLADDGLSVDGFSGANITETLVAVSGTQNFRSLDGVFNYLKDNDNVTVQFVANVVTDKSYSIPAGKTVTFDLAGCTLSCQVTQTTGNQFILNDGNLTIMDSVGGGKISYTDLGNGGEYISDTIYNRATLVINGGTIENLSSSTVATNGYPHAVDTYSGIRDTSVTINDGTIYCASYSAIRMFCVSATYKADLVINGGVIEGAIDMQNGSLKSALGTLTINNGTFNTTANANNIRFANWNGGATEYGISASIVGGTFEGGITTKYVPSDSEFNYGIISGGTFGVDVSDYCAKGYEVVQNADNTFGVEAKKCIEVTDAEGNVTYLTNTRGFNTSNVTLKLIDNVGDYNLNLNKATGVVLDLNGYTFSKQINLNNGAELTIKDSSEAKTGKVIVDKGTNNTYAAVVIMRGTLTIDGGTIETTGTTGAIQASGATLTINDGKIVSNGDGVQLGTWSIAASKQTNVAISGGEIVAAGYGIVDNANCTSTAISITGGTINSTLDSVSVTASTAEISGGTFSTDVSDYCVDGYEVVENADGTYGVQEEVTAVAKIGDVEYSSFEKALAAAKAMTGNVTVEILDKVTLNSNLSGNYDSITFVGADTDAEIFLDVQGYITATGETVAFEDLILSKAEGGYINNAGFMNVAFGVYDVNKVTYTNCTFSNGAYASSGEVTFTGCTFYRSYDKYGLWAYGNVDVTVEECIFDDYRGIKMYAEDKAKTVDLTVTNTDFSAVNNKPAIVLTYGESVTLDGNTYSSTGVFELDLDGAPNGTAITSTDEITCKNDNGACGVIVDGKIYTTVAQAAEVAKAGSTVTLLHDSTETVELESGVTLDKNGYTADGVTVAVGLILEGAGTEESPYLVATIDDLFNLSAMVNAGNNYNNEYFKLTQDIDLSEVVALYSDEDYSNWTPIGTKENPFKGTFDGDGKIISNLVVVGENNVGFIGYADNATIKNVNIVNASVTGVDCVGAVAGQVYSVSTIDNCHVSGLIKIEGQTNVGGIVGKYYTKVSNSSVIGDGTNTSYVKGVYVASDLEGDNIGGIMGHCGENNNLSNNVVKNITISGTRKVGGIVGIADQNTDVTSCTVDNVIIETTATADYANSKVTSMSIGGLIGQYQAPKGEVDGSVTGSSVSNVTFANPNNVTVSIGAVTGGSRGGSTGMLAPSDKITISNNVIEMDTITGTNNEYLLTFAAEINGNKYLTLEEAFAAAETGETINLLADATPALTSQRAITKASTINLNGYTLTLTEDDLYFGTTTFVDGTIIVDPSVRPSTAVFWMFANQTLTFDSVEIVATGVTGTYLIGLDGANADLNLINGSKITVENETALDLDIICVNGFNGNDIVISDSTVNVTNLDGRVFFRGNYTIAGNSQVELEGITKAGFRIEAGQTLSIEDTSTVTVVGEPRDGGINLVDSTATYVKEDTAVVNATVTYPPAAGECNEAYIKNDYISGVGAIFGEASNVNARDSFEIKLYSGETLVGQTALNDPEKVLLNGISKSITWHAALTDDGDSWWITTWTNGALNFDSIPDSFELYVDGEKVDEGTIYFNRADDSYPVIAAIVDNNGAIVDFVSANGYTSNVKDAAANLNTALAEADGMSVVLLRDVIVDTKLTINSEVTLDLNDKVMTLATGGNMINSTVTIKNGNIAIADVDTKATGDSNCFISVNVGKSLTLDDIVMTGDGYTTYWAVLCAMSNTQGSTLKITNSTITMANEKGAKGGFIKDQSGVNKESNIIIENTTLNLTNVSRGFVGGSVVLDTVNLTITGGEHGINGSELEVIDSTVTISNGIGRAITLNGFDASITNSTLNLSNMGEGEIRFKTANTLEIDGTSTLNEVTAYADVAGANINGTEIKGTEDEMSTVSYANQTLTVVNPVEPVAKIGDVSYETLQEAINAVQDGQTIVLLDNVVIDSNIALSKAGTITIDGNGKTITSTYANNEAIACAILLGTTGASDSEAATHVYTIKNVTFDGFTGASLIRAEGVTFTLQDSVVQNNNVTIGYQGLFRLESTFATFDNVQFINNKVAIAIALNYNSDNSESTLNVEDSTFEENTASGAGIIYYATGSGLTVNNSKFIKNTVSTNGNGATLYAGFNTNVYVTNNMFVDNTVTTSHATSKRVAGGLFVGAYGAESYDYNISYNVFDGNSATINSGATAAAASVAFSDYEAGVDLSDNYWGEKEPVVGVDYTVERNKYEVEVNSYYQNYSVATDGTITLEDRFVIMLKIGNVSFATMTEAVEYAKEASITDLVITIVGTNTKDEALALEDSFNLLYGTAFDNVTIKQDNGNMPYYIDTIYTGDRTSADGEFVFDGVNIVITSQIWFESETVRLTNNSIIKRTNDVKNFIYYSNVVIEPGSQFDSQIDDIFGGTVTVDGGKTDGTYTETPSYKSTYFDVRAGQTFTLTNGAYALLNAANEIGRLTLNGNVVVNNSKLEVFNNIPFGENAYLKIIGNSYVQAKVITGSGSIEIDASNITTDTLVIKADMSGYTGTVEAINNNGAYIEITSEGVMVKIGVAEVNDVIYATLTEAIAAASVNGDTVYILADVNEEIADFSNVTLATEVVGGVTVTSTYNSYADFNNVTVVNGVTLNIPYVLASGDVDNVIEGTLNVSSVYYNRYNATTIIRNGGKVTTGGMTIVRYNTDANAGMYIYGDNDDTTVEFSCADTIGVYSGTFYVEGAVIEAKHIWVDHETEPAEQVQINAEFVNSIVNVSSTFRLYNDASLTLTGTNLTANDVQVRVSATPVVEMDSNSSITANTVTNLDNAKLNAKLDENNNVTFFVPVASVNGKNFGSLEEALAAVQDGQTIEILANVEVSEMINFTKDGTYTINGNGYSIIPSASNNVTNSVFNFGQGSNDTVSSRNYIINDLVFDGWNNTDHVLRFQGVTATLDNVTVTNCVQTGTTDATLGLVTFTSSKAYVLNSTFTNNTCKEVIDFNSWGDNAVDPITIDNCTFKNNNVYGAGVVYYATGGGYTLTSSKFVENTISTSNASVLYFSSDANTITNNVFDGNVMNSTGARSGVLICENIETFKKNVFKDNTYSDVTYNAAVVYKADTGTLDVSENYWGGKIDTAVVREGEIVCTTFYTDEALTNLAEVKLPEAKVENLGSIEVSEYRIYNGSLSNVITDNPILLQLAMNFTAQDDEESASNNAYGQYITDFYITMDGAENGSFIANGCYLAGEYGEFGWIMIPIDGLKVENGKAYPVISSVGLGFTYVDICTQVKVFNCGIYFSPEVLAANPNLGVNLTLGLSEDLESAQSGEDFITVDDYDYVAEDFVVAATVDGKAYKTFAEALNAVVENSTLTLYSDVKISEPINVTNDLIIDGNGFSITYTGTNRVITVENSVVADLTVKDLVIEVTSGYSQRGINYNSPNGTLTLDNVTINGDQVTYAINLAGSSNNVTVNITDSTIKGLIALNVWGQNSRINVSNTALISVDNAGHENYTAIALNNNGTTIANDTIVTVTGGSITALDENDNPSTAVRNATQTGEVNISNTTEVVGTISEVVAIVDYGANEFYSCYTLQNAITKAVNDGATVKLLKNIELTETVIVSAGKPITLDLNGFNITYTVNEVVTANTYAIVNNGTLTLVNSSEENAEAEICLTYVPTTRTNYSISTIANNGTLNVESAYINCVNGGNNISYAIDNYSSVGDAVINVTGGCVYGGAGGYSIRMFASSTTNNNELNVTGGTIWYVWAQNPNTNANKVEINVEGGTVGYVYVSAVNETCNCEKVTLNLKADCMEYAPATGTIPEDYTLENVEGYYTLVKHNYVAEVDGVKYESLQEALDNASVGDVVTLIKDSTITSRVNVAKELTIDLNGYTLTTEVSDEYGAIYVKIAGDLTITDSSENADGKITSTSKVLIGNYGTVTVEAGTLTNGNDLSSDTSIYNFYYNATTYGKAKVVGGTVGTVWNCGKFELIDGEINRIDNSGNFVITGGKVTGEIISRDGADASGVENAGTIAISGGTFTQEVPAELCENGYLPIANEDGTYGVEYSFNFATYSLTLNGTIDVNVYTEFYGALRTDNDAYVDVVMPNGERVLSRYVVDIIADGYDTNGRHRFTIPVAAAYLTTEFEIQLYVDDEAVGNKMTVSVKKYADYVFANADSFSTELKDTMTALLNYGARAQELFDVNTDNLAADTSQDITSVTSDMVNAMPSTQISGSTPNVAVGNASLLLESTTTIRVYFKLTGSIEGYTFTVDGVDVTSNVQVGETVCGIEISNILASDLDKVYTIVVTDGTNTLTVQYSALTYVKTVINNSSLFSSELVNAVKALYLYNQAAEAFVEANQ